MLPTEKSPHLYLPAECSPSIPIRFVATENKALKHHAGSLGKPLVSWWGAVSPDNWGGPPVWRWEAVPRLCSSPTCWGILLKQPSLTIEKTTHVSLHKSLWPAGKAWLHTLAQIQGILAQGRRHHSRHFHIHQPRDTGEGGSWLLQNPAPFPHAWHDLDGRNLCHKTGLDTFPLVYSCTRSWDDLFFFFVGGGLTSCTGT